jgi:colicin import membrane protein
MQLNYANRAQTFEKNLIKALLLHGVLVFLFFASGLLNINFFHKKIEFEQTIQSAVKVDIVGMPKLTVQELKEFKASDIQKGDDDAKPEEVKAKETDSTVDLGSLLTNLSKKKKPTRKRRAKKNYGSSLSDKELKALVNEGNKLSKGETVLGDSLKESRSLFEQYASRLPSHVRPNWKLPTYLLEKNLACRIRVYISKTGEVLRTELIQSSGVDEYDSRALRAIKASNPFPVPEDSISTFLVAGQVVLGFPL